MHSLRSFAFVFSSFQFLSHKSKGAVIYTRQQSYQYVQRGYRKHPQRVHGPYLDGYCVEANIFSRPHFLPPPRLYQRPLIQHQSPLSRLTGTMHARAADKGKKDAIEIRREPRDSAARENVQPGSMGDAPRTRNRPSCLSCKKIRTKCSGKKTNPCDRCQSHGTECEGHLSNPSTKPGKALPPLHLAIEAVALLIPKRPAITQSLPWIRQPASQMGVVLLTRLWSFAGRGTQGNT